MTGFSGLEGAGLAPVPSFGAAEIVSGSAAGTEASVVCDLLQPVAFEEFWLGFVTHAARMLESNIAPTLRGAVLQDPEGPLRSLLIELAEIGGAAAFDLFAGYRLREQSAEFVFGGGSPSDSRDLYLAFVRELVSADLSPLWDAFPALRPLLQTRTELFIDATAEFCRRWTADRDALAAAFPDLDIGDAPHRIRPGLSDAHGAGRTVARLEFESGGSLYYKPRCVDMEAGFAQFIQWFNGHDHDIPPLRALWVLRRPGYGWMEEAQRAPCADSCALARFHRRQGAILALGDLFQAVDFHCENLVASGEQPVLVDLETLFHVPGPFEPPSPERPLERIELLPRPIRDRDGLPYVICGLGVVPDGVDIQVLRRAWRNVNRDAMAPCEIAASWSGEAVPRLAGGSPAPVDAVGEIVAGFCSTHRFFRNHAAVLWSADGPIARAFAGRHSRFILRATRVYAQLLRRAVEPRALGTSSAADCVFNRLARTGEGWDDLYRVERQALRRGDIPCFHTAVTARFLAGEEWVSPHFFTSTGFEAARYRAALMDDAALQERVESIRRCLENANYPGWSAVPTANSRTVKGD